MTADTTVAPAVPATPDTTTTTTETPVVKTEATKDTPLMSSQFAALQKGEKQLREERAKLKDVQAQKDAMDKAIKEAKKDPLKYLEAAGLTINDVAEYLLNDNKPTPSLEMKALQDQVNEIKAEKEAQRKAEEEARLQSATAQTQQVIETAKKNTMDSVKANEKYELINALDYGEEVWNQIVRHHNETLANGTPEVLTVDQAADIIESTLEQLLEKATATKKYQAKASPSPVVPSLDAALTELADQRVQSRKKTLTNKMAPSTPIASGDKPKSRDEARKLAAQMFEAMKKGQ